MHIFNKWAQEKYSDRQRYLAMLPLVLLFMVVLPATLVLLSNVLDARLHLPRWRQGPLNTICAVSIGLAGWLLAIWSIHAQLTSGKGTPIPPIPTQKLLANGPFAYCRNPMTLGTILAFLGIAILLGSPSAVILVLVGTLLLLIYIKVIEEKELEMRFGAEYLKYKADTPFLIPLPRKRRKD